jgi:hypothetical protein
VRKVVLLSAILAIAGLMPTRGFVAFARATQQPAPRFRSGIDVVEVVVLARDREGRPITDLQASGPGSEQVGFPIDTAKLSAGATCCASASTGEGRSASSTPCRSKSSEDDQGRPR